MTKPFVIKGVNVNLESSQLKDVKSIQDLQKLEIFNHLSYEEKDKAEKELMSKLGKKNEAQEIVK